MHESLHYLHGKPNCMGIYRQFNDDFMVEELLPFSPTGSGEHVFLLVEKNGIDTLTLINQIAKSMNLDKRLFGYAGLKDKYARTRQWISVHIPGKLTPDFNKLKQDQFQILQQGRHDKKLKIGALLGNRFKLVLRDLSATEHFEKRWQQITANGVPNYFGEQRFGHQYHNLTQAQRWFAGEIKVKDRKKKGFYLSAARSFLFNLQVSQRIEAGFYNRLLAGDVAMLAGSQSIFNVELVDDSLTERLSSGDIAITASLWGAGESRAQGEVKTLEQSVVRLWPQLGDGLVNHGLKQERRRINLKLANPSIEFDGNVGTIEFALPAGSFATSVLRELLQYRLVDAE